PFVMHRVAMLESAAWRALTLASRLLLDRLEIENARNAGTRNGDLVASYDDFLEHMGRKRPHAVAAAIKEVVRLGFVGVVQRGQWNDGRDRRASRYRLTYLPTGEKLEIPPTDEWRSSLTKTSVRNTDENVSTEPRDH